MKNNVGLPVWHLFPISYYILSGPVGHRGHVYDCSPIFLHFTSNMGSLGFLGILLLLFTLSSAIRPEQLGKNFSLRCDRYGPNCFPLSTRLERDEPLAGLLRDFDIFG